MGNLIWGTDNRISNNIDVVLWLGPEDCYDGGVQLTLPMENLGDKLRDIREKYQAEEIRMLDYESDLDIKVNAYDDFMRLNESLQELEDNYMGELNKVRAILEEYPSEDLDQVLSMLNSYTLNEDLDSLSKIAYDYLDNSVGELPSLIMANIDLESLGQDLVSEGDQALTTYGLLMRR